MNDRDYLSKNSPDIESRIQGQGHKLSAWAPSKAVRGAQEATCQKCKGKVVVLQGRPSGEILSRPCTHNDWHRPVVLQRVEQVAVAAQLLLALVDLRKMALADIRRGRRSSISMFPRGQEYSYKHVLPKGKGLTGYQLFVEDIAGDHESVDPELGLKSVLKVHLRHPSDHDDIGEVSGTVGNDGRLHMGESAIFDHDRHGGKGLGLAMYEALFAHAKNVHGAHTVFGENHSTSASGVHSALARKHGLDYRAEPDPASKWQPGPFDAKFKPYSYQLK